MVQNIILLAEFLLRIMGFVDFFGPWVACSRYLCKDWLGSRKRSYNYSFYINRSWAKITKNKIIPRFPISNTKSQRSDPRCLTHWLVFPPHWYTGRRHHWAIPYFRGSCKISWLIFTQYGEFCWLRTGSWGSLPIRPLLSSMHLLNPW